MAERGVRRVRDREPLVRSVAIHQFEQNVLDYNRLMAMHVEMTGAQAGRRYGVEVLNKSAVLLIYACWEAFVEDLLSELIARVLRRAESPSDLPDALKKYIKKQLEQTRHEYAIWAIAGPRWRSHLLGFLTAVAEHRNFGFNTATADRIDVLFSDSIGITLSGAWHWNGMSIKNARLKVKMFVRLRGALAHRSVAKVSVTKATVEDFASFIQRLVEVTDRFAVRLYNENGFGNVTVFDLATVTPPTLE